MVVYLLSGVGAEKGWRGAPALRWAQAGWAKGWGEAGGAPALRWARGGGGELRSAQLAFAALRLAHGLSPYEKRQK